MSQASDEGFRYLDVAADVGVEAWAPDLPGCFRQALRGLFSLIVPLDSVRPVETRELAAQGEPVDALLVQWLNEAIYLHDIEGFVLHDLDPPEVGPARVHALLRGEAVDPTRHPRGLLVKAATFHDLALVQEPGRVTARVILDI